MESDEKPGPRPKLSQEELDELMRLIYERMATFIESDRDMHPSIMDSARSQAVNETLRAITAKTGDAPENVMLVALTLYEVVTEALSEGQRLVLVDKDYRFVREGTGLLQDAPDPSPHEKVAG